MAVSSSSALDERLAGVGDPLGELVAHPLELAEVEGAGRRRDGGDPVLDRDPREGLGDEAGELVLEAADLAPQLDAGKALVAARR